MDSQITKPRVAICITVYEPGGQRVVIDEQTRALSDRYDFVLLTESKKTDAPSHLQFLLQKPWVSRMVPVPNMSLRNTLSEFDLIHCHDSFAYIWEATKTDVPVVVTSHGNCPALFREDLRLKMEYYMSEPLYGLAYKRADRVVAISKSVQRWLASRYGVSSALCYNGVDLQKFSGSSGERAPAFLYVGEMSKRKGVPALISAFRAFRRRHPEFRLWLAGFGPLASLVANLGGEGVEFLGYVPDDKLARLYASATAFVSPSYWEGFGLPILESYASGTRVVARRGYAMTEFLEGTGCGVLFDNDDLLEDALHKILAIDFSPSRARALASQYSWANSTQCLSRVYQGALGLVDRS
ncbi:MAG: glycosyltransferase family 4 protein [Vulcanimicrobiaceae bacterium]